MKKGITLVTVSAMILIMVIIGTTVTITGANALNNSKKMKFATELTFLQEAVDNYKLQNSGSLPINQTALSDIGSLPSGTYNEIDLTLLGNLDIQYGNKSNSDANDIYVLNATSGDVYYLKGVKIGSNYYYNLNDELKNIINYTNTDVITRDGIKFEQSTKEYTNQAIASTVRVPADYTNVTVSSNGSSVALSSNDGVYNVYTISKSSNYNVVVSYTKDSDSLKQTFTVSNFDNVSPTISVESKTPINNEQTSITISKNDNLSGVKFVKYTPDKVEEAFFTTDKKGIEIQNDNVSVNKVTKYVTFYIEDNAGNYTILQESLDSNVSTTDYISYGLIAHYDAINNTGNGHSTTTTTWKDLSGNGNDATLLNFNNTSSSGWGSDRLIFDGTDDYVRLNNIFTGLDGFTIEYVFNQKIDKSFQYICGTLNNRFGVEAAAACRCRLYFSNPQSNFISFHNMQPSLNKIEKNSWVYDGQSLKGFLNSSLKDSASYTDLVYPGSYFGIGADGNGMYPTKMDCYSVRVYNRALTDEEIKHNYLIDKSRFGL